MAKGGYFLKLQKMAMPEQKRQFQFFRKTQMTSSTFDHLLTQFTTATEPDPIFR